jgi:hypothetical protein
VEGGDTFEILNFDERGRLGDLGRDRRVALKLILGKRGVNVCNELIWH